MGYSGFGLQKWIFNQRARKPFTNSRKSASQGSVFSNNFNVPVGLYDKEQAIKNISKRRRIDFFIASTFVIVVLGLGYFFINGFSIHEKETLQYKLDNELVFKVESFEILKESGDKYFNSKDFLNASKEYELAYKVEITAELNGKLLSCYFELCKTNSAYCTKYNNLKNEK